MDIFTFYEKLKQYCKARAGSFENCKECKMGGFCFDVAIITPSSLEGWRLDVLHKTVGYLQEACQTKDE